MSTFLGSFHIDNIIQDISHSLFTEKIQFKIETNHLKFSSTHLVSLGLIINELITNSVKYAFSKNQNVCIIDINIYSKRNELIFHYKDNGEGANFENLKKGFGYKLIQALAIFELNGKVDFFNYEGFNSKIIFSKNLFIDVTN